MAFPALCLPRDNDQGQSSLWLDNDDLAIPGDSFCDQFVTFDSEDAATLGGEIFDDPPSPSILLENLQNELSNPVTYSLDLPLDEFHPETPATVRSDPIPIAPAAISADQLSSDSGTLGSDSAILAALAGDPILSTGSISDSELLRLEGISIKSSPHRGNATAPSSPMSPRKHSRLVESGYATIRRGSHRPKPAAQEPFGGINMADLDAFLDNPRSGLDFFDMNYDDFTDPIIPIKQETIERHGLPSPPLTGRIPNAQERQHNPSGFVTGHLDDPFCDNLLDMSTPTKQQDMNTPMGTPIPNGEAFSQGQTMTPLNTNMDTFRHSRKSCQRTSSAKWPTEGFLTDVRYNDDPNVWSSTSSSAIFAPDSGSSSMPSPGWWDVSPTEILHASPTHHHHSGVLGNAGHHHMHSQRQAELPFEYNDAEFSGLMIHMPQPRAPPPSVLNSSLSEHVLATPGGTSSSSNNYHSHIQGTPTMTHRSARHMSSSQYNGHSHSKEYGRLTDKRPRPRAPSSGARHHHYQHPGGAQTSPRKLRTSISLNSLREEAQSPSPMDRRQQHRQHSGHHHQQQPHPGSGNNHNHNNHQEWRQHRSSSLTMRKQRSFSRRTPSATYSSSAPGGNAGGGEGGGGGGGGSGGSLDFVNFTPNDRKQLMTGVAPSGSSKTKARREKEAQEREIAAQEKLRQVVEAVGERGGDLKRLIGDFHLKHF
ncbi:hypothetical protein F4678DRAFT_385260 [Xylaria arbuscula]|nr:hypothetical protein F4678DRAFT_385260 [Xylaria arbuscula]